MTRAEATDLVDDLIQSVLEQERRSTDRVYDLIRSAGSGNVQHEECRERVIAALSGETTKPRAVLERCKAYFEQRLQGREASEKDIALHAMLEEVLK